MKVKHILLIDDNDIDNYVSNHVVKKSQITDKITIKNSAIAALEYLEEIKNNSDEFPELIFLDIKMPIMDGFGFLDQFILFQMAVEGKCSVIMLSSSSDPMDINRALQYPVVKQFMTKPLKIEMLGTL